MTLQDDVRRFIDQEATPDRLVVLIDRCLDEGGAVGLACLRQMAESDYGGMTFKFELQSPAASSLLLFGEAGLRELYDIALHNLDRRQAKMSLELLASIAAGSGTAPLSLVDQEFAIHLDDHLKKHPTLSDIAQRYLTEIVLAYRDEDDLIMSVGSALSNLTTSSKPAARKLFEAISARWLAISAPVLSDYQALLTSDADNEATFQKFLTIHPHILDPFAVEVWPQPDLYGFKAPDFIIQRADNAYVLVEIECPAKKLVTGRKQVAAEVTHAVSQVTDYDQFLTKKFGDLEKYFKGWDLPELLVVCGLERELDSEQTLALRNFNRGSRAKVVGFDWLAQRANAVSDNVLRGKINVSKIRLV